MCNRRQIRSCASLIVVIAQLPGLLAESKIYQGNQTSGIQEQPPSTVNTVTVQNLTGGTADPAEGTTYQITPSTGTAGILLSSNGGANLTVNSGSAGNLVNIATNGQAGILVNCVGTAPLPAPDPFLGVPIPGSATANGGDVLVQNFGSIKTAGTGAHGIAASAKTPGYPDSMRAGLVVLDTLVAINPAFFTFTVATVQKPDATEALVGGTATVAGAVIVESAEGHIVRTGQEAGSFTFNPNGTLSFALGSGFDDLGAGESRQVIVNYTVDGTNTAVPPVRTQSGIRAQLCAWVYRDAATGQLKVGQIFAAFDGLGWADYGTAVSAIKPVPDIKGYLDGLLAEIATGGGAGNTVTVNHNTGKIVTTGKGAYGIYADSTGGAGAAGSGGGGFWSFGATEPGGGKDGKTGGNVAVTVDGAIETRLAPSGTPPTNTSGEAAIGVFAHSAGGAGGTGGDGGTWYWGRPGGAGGTGGTVNVLGSGTITTSSRYGYGIYALSEGGNGGTGGEGHGAMGAGNGGLGGTGGIVHVNGTWDLTTTGQDAYGIWAKSVGGTAGSGGSGGWMTGDSGTGGAALPGGKVTLISGGKVQTSGIDAYGLFAQSVGGFGGSGGAGGSIFYARGGSGASAGDGGEVVATNATGGEVKTTGVGAHGLYAQSVGGGGGAGGGAGALVGFGGAGSAGGKGGPVTATNNGTITASGAGARGIYAQSIGGGGGDGGDSGGLVAVGGTGSSTSPGGTVTVNNGGTIYSASSAIFAQSIGGGGGNGGSSTGWFSIGGKGGGGGDAAAVTVTNSGAFLKSTEAGSSAIFAQSIGGGGGSGGGSVAVGAFVSLAVGGKGEKGGAGSTVTVTSTALADPAVNNGFNIEATKDRSSGIFAQSIGGGGGNGGFSFSAAAGFGAGIAIGAGGDAGGGGDANTVKVENWSSIKAAGIDANGIFAESIGGGGGTGGFSVAMAGSDTFAATFSIGGTGGKGGDGKMVTVENHGLLDVTGERSVGLRAQSVGGGGGDGGFSVSAAGAGTGAIAIGVGGEGGEGGTADIVDVDNFGKISTKGTAAYALFAQSVGGGGGNGGFSISGAAAGTAAAALSIGGKGNGAGDGKHVEVDNSGTISTEGERAYGLFAQSVGGGGGNGGFALGLAGAGTAAGTLNVGGKGAGGGGSGTVDVTNLGTITTDGLFAHGLLAQSVGGGGGNGGFSLGGAGAGTGAVTAGIGGFGDGGGDAAAVDVTNSGKITTKKDGAYALFAQSAGGGGGSGGFSIAGSGAKTASATFTLGGSGGGGGAGSTVDLTNLGELETNGLRAYGILAQSVGGGGGSGGFAFSGGAAMTGGTINASLGGTGKGGGVAKTVDLANHGAVTTHGDDAHALFAQSVGGGGGSGGFSGALSASVNSKVNLSLAIGGSGGAGNDSDVVTLTNTAALKTFGAAASGIYAQSVGGGGGDGGGALALVLSKSDSGANLGLAFGGSGKGGGDGKRVNVTNSGTITTEKEKSDAIFAQSLGGGGGNGGFAASGMLTIGSNSKALSVAIGGGGDGGGEGGVVAVKNSGTLNVAKTDARGVVAQSLGGGGGHGGFSFAGDVGSSLALSVAVGGTGGPGGNGGLVVLGNDGTVETHGENGHGLFAQSVGGGGGDGGMSITGNITGISAAKKQLNATVTVGGSGGIGGTGGAVYAGYGLATPTSVTPTAQALAGAIDTFGNTAHGLFAQSVGGGGGQGGAALACTFTNDSNLGKEGKALTTTWTFGGDGGAGNTGGAVFVNSAAAIHTRGELANGIYAQSIGGGGGAGGSAKAISLSTSSLLPFKDFGGSSLGLSITAGGDGGSGNTGGAVQVTNAGAIETDGLRGRGIFAQSVGGGGGSVAESILGKAGQWIDGAMNVMSAFDLVNFLGDTFQGKWTSNLKPTSLSITIGGDGGDNADAETVAVTNTGTITTHGKDSHAIHAQSVGGGGGEAQAYATGTGDGEDVDVGIGLLGEFVIGGAGGASGDGAKVTVTNQAALKTFGEAAYGIFAQSVGGGGGQSGSVTGGGFSSWDKVGLGMGFRRDGGCAGDGGEVVVTNSATIATSGANAVGVFAQSVGGGGGLVGNREGLAWFGSVGGDGSSGAVAVAQSGDITTTGAAAHGIVAQSCAGDEEPFVEVPEPDTETEAMVAAAPLRNLAGAVAVTLAGKIDVAGAEAVGIVAQSAGGDAAGAISITVNSGSINGGSGGGTAVRFLDGAANTLTNRGTLAARSGVAVIGGKKAETVENLGTINGNIDLREGANAFNNRLAGTFNTGSSVIIGAGNWLTNEGVLSPGGAAIEATTITGNLRQTGGGASVITVDHATGAADRIAVLGSTELAGTMRFTQLNTATVKPGGHKIVFLTSTGAIAATGLALNQAKSVVIDYRLGQVSATSLAPNPGAAAVNSLAMEYTVDFAPDFLGRNLLETGRYFNRVQNAGSAAALADTINALIAIPEATGYREALARLSPDFYGEQQVWLYRDMQRFMESALGPRTAAADARGNAFWVEQTVATDSHGAFDDYQAVHHSNSRTNAGFEKKFGRWTTGVTVGSGRGKAGGFAGRWTAEERAKFAAASLRCDVAGTEIAAGLTYGRSTTESERWVDLTTPVRGAVERDLDVFGGSVTVAHAFSRSVTSQSRLYVRPQVELGAITLKADAATETGGGAQALALTERRETQTWATMRLEAGLRHEFQNGCVLRPSVSFDFQRYLGSATSFVRASLVAAPAGVEPMLEPVGLGQDLRKFGAGLELVTPQGYAIGVSYRNLAAAHAHSNSASFSVAYRF